MAGNMRRLIESIINQCVLISKGINSSKKTLNISAFSQFTRLVRLTNPEANELREIYIQI